MKYLSIILVLLGLISCGQNEIPEPPAQVCVALEFEKITCQNTDSFYLKGKINGKDMKIVGYDALVNKTMNMHLLAISYIIKEDSCTSILKMDGGGHYGYLFRQVNDTVHVQGGIFGTDFTTIQRFTKDKSGETIPGQVYPAKEVEILSKTNIIVLTKINGDSTIYEGSFAFEYMRAGSSKPDFVITDGRFRLKTCRK